jgi:phosphoglycolate phosphatase-like HAD superfamily hydrolase
MTLPAPAPLRVAVYDCDGVLLDTVTAKLAAFRDWVPAEHAGRREEFSRYNRGAFGRSRRVQIRHFYEGILGGAISESRLDAEVERFARINAGHVRAAAWLPGSREFLNRAAAAGIPQYVLSGTPEAELRTMLRDREADHLFRGIVGSPTTKAAGLRQIIAETGVDPRELWFVGDATHDGEAAREVGVTFVYKPSDAEFHGAGTERQVASLLEIPL